MTLHMAKPFVAGPARCLSLGRHFSCQASPLRVNRNSRQGETDALVSSMFKPGGSSNLERRTNSDSLHSTLGVMGQRVGAGTRRAQQSRPDMIVKALQSQGMSRLKGRDWKTGDIYAPHDLSSTETKKWRLRRLPDRDVFDTLNINPLDEWKNFALLAEFMTPMGRIKHRSETGLRPKNQRKIAKAIRRATGMGFHPSVHVHPELLRRKGPWEFR